MAVTVRFVLADGREQIVAGADGQSVMETAVNAGIDGIVGECGGNLACATCHCHIGPQWRALIEPPGEMEEAMLDCALNVTEDSRLGCQVKLSQALDDMVVIVPQ